MQIAGNIFIITGGASGLGAATARMIVENVMLNDETIRLDGALRTQPRRPRMTHIKCRPNIDASPPYPK
jgi:NAD(P)-dependent dehydrogenase (short-subunit alcohol dehydrogenase family)